MTAQEETPFGAVIRELWATIESRRDADAQQSYTAKLLQGDEDQLLKKIGEESCEVVMAAKDHDPSPDHLRYELGDLLYHSLVVCARYGLTPDDLAAELQARFK